MRSRWTHSGSTAAAARGEREEREQRERGWGASGAAVAARRQRAPGDSSGCPPARTCRGLAARPRMRGAPVQMWSARLNSSPPSGVRQAAGRRTGVGCSCATRGVLEFSRDQPPVDLAQRRRRLSMWTRPEPRRVPRAGQRRARRHPPAAGAVRACPCARRLRLPRGSPARSWHAGRHSADVAILGLGVPQDKINKLPTKRPNYWTCDMPLSVSSPYSKHP